MSVASSTREADLAALFECWESLFRTPLPAPTPDKAESMVQGTVIRDSGDAKAYVYAQDPGVIDLEDAR